VNHISLSQSKAPEWRLSHICAKLLQKDPFSRYHTFHEVPQDIDRFRNSGEAFQMVRYKAGDVIFNEGDSGDFAFSVISGKVEVLRVIDGRQKVIATMGRMKSLGNLPFLPRKSGPGRCARPRTIPLSVS